MCLLIRLWNHDFTHNTSLHHLHFIERDYSHCYLFCLFICFLKIAFCSKRVQLKSKPVNCAKQWAALLWHLILQRVAAGEGWTGYRMRLRQWEERRATSHTGYLDHIHIETASLQTTCWTWVTAVPELCNSDFFPLLPWTVMSIF